MTDKLDAATIRELLAKITQGEWEALHEGRCSHVRSQDREFETGCIMFGKNGTSQGNAGFIAAAPAIARYALELSDKVERLEDREQYARHTSDRWCAQTLKLSTENDELRAQLQSQAAELERLRAWKSQREQDDLEDELASIAEEGSHSGPY